MSVPFASAAYRGAATAVAVAVMALTPARASAETAAAAPASAAAPAPASAAASAPASAAASAPAAAPAAATAAAPATATAPAPAPLAAATAATPLNVRPTHPVTYASDPVGAGFGWKLGLFGLALAGGYFLWKRRAPASATPAPKIRIVARQAVGVRSEILIVEIEGDRLLLGVTPQSIARIGDLPPAEPEAQSSAELDPRASPAAVAARAQELAREFDRARRPAPSRERGDVGARISALLGNPGAMVPAPVIATRSAGAQRGRAAGRHVDLVVDGDVDVGEPAGAVGHVEEQARGLLRAARRP